MTQPALKLNVYVAFPSYGGNGGIASEHPDIREWWCETLLKMKADPRIGEITTDSFNDTPITMLRNRMVLNARRNGAHLLMMVDSDQSPLMHQHEPWYRPFWDTAFDEIYRHYQAGPLVIGAPYCGPPGAGENVYVFQWDNFGDRHGEETSCRLEQYTRAEAARMTGVTEVAALPTGLTLWDMRIFDITEPSGRSDEEILDLLAKGEITQKQAIAELHSDGWFYYEWTDKYASQKASTEDVTATRDVCLAAAAVLGYNPLRCTWDSWIGHHKPWCVGKPTVYSTDQVASSFSRAVDRGLSTNERTIELGDANLAALGIDLNRLHANGNGEAAQRAKQALDDLPPDRTEDGAPLQFGRYWESDQSFSGEPSPFFAMTPKVHIEALKDLVIHFIQQKERAPFIIEIGSWVGESALAMASVHPDVKVHCIDHFQGCGSDWTGRVVYESAKDELYQRFLRNIEGCRNQITHDRADSIKAAESWGRMGPPPFFLGDPEADIVFIDADHGYETTKADILAWLPHLKDDGVMIGHDYLTVQFPGVAKAVHEVFGQDIVTPYCFTTQGGFWLVKKADYLAKTNGEKQVELAGSVAEAASG